MKITRKEYNALVSKLESLTIAINGGKGSGNFGHSGRPGLVGGSGDGKGTPTSKAKREKARLEEILGEKADIADERFTDDTRYIHFDHQGKYYSYEKSTGRLYSGEEEILHPAVKKAEADDDPIWQSYDIKGSDIKAKLKSYGLETKDLAVKKGQGGYSRSFTITGSGKKHDLKSIEQIVTKKLQDVSYDGRSGEILAGGNTYVFVTDRDHDEENSFDDKTLNGGKGSGNFGHAGRPGQIGGSAEGTSLTNEHLRQLYEANRKIDSIITTLSAKKAQTFDEFAAQEREKRKALRAKEKAAQGILKKQLKKDEALKKELETKREQRAKELGLDKVSTRAYVETGETPADYQTKHKRAWNE